MTEEPNKSRKPKDLRKYDLILVDDGGGGAVVYRRGQRPGRFMPKPGAVRALQLMGMKALEINLSMMDLEQERMTIQALDNLVKGKP